jgi:hypothetical protein
MPATLLDARLLSGDRHQRGDDRGHSHGALLIGAKEERGGGDHPGAPPPGRLSDDDLAAVAHPTARRLLWCWRWRSPPPCGCPSLAGLGWSLMSPLVKLTGSGRYRRAGLTWGHWCPG